MNKYTLLVMTLLAAVVTSCEKGDERNDCERCTYTFRGNTAAGSLVFEYKHYFFEGRVGGTSTPYRGLSVEAPAGANAFSYGDKDIASDKVNHLFMCMNCGAVAFKPVGGTIRGRKIDDRTWLLDARVYLESQTDLRDTIVFKQFFTNKILHGLFSP